MSDETWIALQRRCLPRALPVVTKTSSDDWLVVDERETVVAVVSPEIDWETNDPSTAQTRAYLIAAAPEMYELLNKIRGHIDSTCRECESKAIVPEIDALLDKIEGGTE